MRAVFWFILVTTLNSTFGFTQTPTDKSKELARIEKAEKELKDYEDSRAAAGEGNTEAMFRVGEMLSAGLGVPKDQTASHEWYRKAAEKGHGEAQVYLFLHYTQGVVVAKDNAKAVEWLQKSATGGYVSAQRILGRAYQKGELMPKDGSKAVEWFRRAAMQGDLESQELVSLHYQFGIGVPKDEVEALAWLNITAAVDDGSRAFRVKSRNIMEASLGRQMTLVAQSRSKQIFHEINMAKS